MNTVKLIKEITFASIVSVLLMMPFGSVFAEYDPITVEPNNIPTWGPTWCKDTITYRIDNISGLSPDIQGAMKEGITDWKDHAPTNSSGISFSIVEVEDGETPDMILKYKKGGGRVQGQALQQNDNGCFTQVKINVSGKAFGINSDVAQVKSIALQEVGHGLGLLHSDNKKDVMYGQVQSSPNVLLSECDIEAWSLVMKWYVDGDSPYDPGSQTVICGEPGTDPEPSTTATHATVDYTSKGGRMTVTVTLEDKDADPDAIVPNTAVKIELSREGAGVVYQGTKTTDGSGNAKWNFVGVPSGTYSTIVLEPNVVTVANFYTK